MLIAHFVAVVIAVAAGESPAVSSFSDGPLRISGEHVATSIVHTQEEPAGKSRWKCKADGSTTLQFGDITASADGIKVDQMDGERYTFELTGNAALRVRGLSAKATEISWSMDGEPLVLTGNATLTVVIDGKETMVASDRITLDVHNTIRLSDGTVTRLPSSKTHSIVQ